MVSQNLGNLFGGPFTRILILLSSTLGFPLFRETTTSVVGVLLTRGPIYVFIHTDIEEMPKFRV